MVGTSHCCLKQLIKSPVVFHKIACERSCFVVLLWSHLPPPILL
jgi:hypothetical protein